MAKLEHLEILKQGVAAWNKWRKDNPAIKIDLEGADLRGKHLERLNLNGAYLARARLGASNLEEANLSEAQLHEGDLGNANLHRADLNRADLFKAYLGNANLSMSNLSEVSLYCANLGGANLSESNIRYSNLHGANLRGADLSKANLQESNLIFADLVRTNLEGANLIGCRIYGISAWGLRLRNATQRDLIINFVDEPTITVDNLEVAQFIYLLLDSNKIRQVIDTITSKVVLILGRFSPPNRKAILDAIREELRKRDYVPILFDFEKPASRDFTETISTLARMARFIIADITEPRSIPQELQAIIPDLSVPVQPLLQYGSSGEYGMFQDLRNTRGF